MKKVLIIGGGTVGMGVASKLARESKDFSISVFQDKDYVSFGACGIPYYVANDFKNIDLLNSRTTNDFANKNFKSHIKFFLNTKIIAVNLQKQFILYSNQRQEEVTKHYDYLVLAMGAKPQIFPPFISGALPENCYVVNDKRDAEKIKIAAASAKKIIIIGGSYIGLEMAESLLKFNKQVIIIEAQKQLLANILEPEFNDLILSEITANNSAEIFLDNQVETLNIKNNKVVAVQLKFANSKEITCDMVIIATGIKPNTNFIQNLNLKFSKQKALLTNKYLQVLKNTADLSDINNINFQPSYHNIYSAGDCAHVYNKITNSINYIALATTANKMARVIAHNIIVNNHNYLEFPGTLGSSILRINHLAIATTGIKDDYFNSLDVKSVFVNDYDIPKYFHNSKPLALKLFYNKNNLQLLRAQMVGYNNSVLRINALALAIWNKMKVSELANVDFVYAPPFSRTVDIIQLAARQVNSKSK